MYLHELGWQWIRKRAADYSQGNQVSALIWHFQMTSELQILFQN